MLHLVIEGSPRRNYARKYEAWRAEEKACEKLCLPVSIQKDYTKS